MRQKCNELDNKIQNFISISYIHTIYTWSICTWSCSMYCCSAVQAKITLILTWGKLHFKESSKAAHSFHTRCLKGFRYNKCSDRYYWNIDEKVITWLELSLETWSIWKKRLVLKMWEVLYSSWLRRRSLVRISYSGWLTLSKWPVLDYSKPWGEVVKQGMIDIILK